MTVTKAQPDLTAADPNASTIQPNVLVRLDRHMAALALSGAPLLLALATFFWQDGIVGPTAAILQVYSFALWAVVFVVLATLLRSTFPRAARWGMWLGMLVSIAGAGWAYDGLYTSAYLMAGADEEMVATANASVFPAQFLTLYLPGLLFPLTLAVAGLGLWRARFLPQIIPWLLVLGALGFPVSRMPRIQPLAHAADLLLLLPLVVLAWRIARGTLPYPTDSE